MLSALTLLSLVLVSFAANPYATYPSVARSASINGFADPIYGQVPECAKECLKKDTSVTPCPYWDPGCLCVIPTFAGAVAECIAQNCQGDLVQLATDLAVGLCNSVGANTWMIPASLVTALSEARKEAVATATSAEQSLASAQALPAALSSAESTVTTAASVESSKAVVSTTSAPSSAAPASSSKAASSAATSSAKPASSSAATSSAKPASSSAASSVASASTFQGLAAAHAVPVVALAIAMVM